MALGHPGHCRDFTRSELLRTGAAQAGSGLPGIEAGMPAPAGTGLSRRRFLMRALGLGVTVYGAAALTPRALEHGIASAAADVPTDPVMVTVFATGGWDALSVLAPVNDPAYARLRPNLALAPSDGTQFAEDPRLHWHPSLAGLAQLHGEGKVTVVPAIGYASPDASHFTSRHYWEVGATDPLLRLGWLGRYLDQHGSPDNPLQGLTLDTALSPALAPATVPVATVSNPGRFDFAAQGVSSPVQQPMLDAFARFGQLPRPSDAYAQATSATRTTAALHAELAAMTASSAPYPAGDLFPIRLASLANILSAGLPVRCVAVPAPGGYDTHSNQKGQLPGNLSMLGDSLLAFQRDLEARGLAHRVVTLVWSEFGRRAHDNGTGSDHGAGGAALLVGSPVAGAMVGEFPGLASLDANGNLVANCDFRSVYCSLLEQWLGVDAGSVVPGAGGFARPQLIR